MLFFVDCPACVCLCRWISSSGSSKSEDIFIEQVSLQGDNLLMEPVQIASVIATPAVYPSNKIVYLTASPFVSLNGSNFNEKDTHLYFSPPLQKGVDVSVVVSMMA